MRFLFLHTTLYKLWAIFLHKMPQKSKTSSSLASMNARIRHASGFTKTHLSKRHGVPNAARSVKTQMIASKKS